VEGRCDDLEVGNPESSLCDKELFADRTGSLPRLGPPLPAGIQLALRSIPLLAQALLT
jgi:hypothetical protein